MLLSDRDLRQAIAAGRLGLTPYDEAMLQPSSIDVRLDRYFRVFANHRYSHIDPAVEQDELTELVEPPGDEPFVLHPGEFVLGSTLEVVTLGDDLAARLEGKALAWHTWVPTPKGARLLVEIKPGDEVFGLDGRPTAVLYTSEVMLGRPCFEVFFSDGTSLVADASHEWLTSTQSERARGERAGVRTTEQIALTLRSGRELNHHLPIAGALDFPTAELPVDPYVLGIWLGDGTSTTADVTTADQEVVGVGAATGARDASTGRFAASGSLHSTLRAMQLLGDKHVPNSYLHADIEQRLALLQGLMDSDGHCDVYGRCEFVSTKAGLAQDVADLAASLGLRPKQRAKRAMLNGQDCGPAHQVKFVPHLPVFRLPRKLARQRPATARFHRHRGITDVRPVASLPVKCIEVANPDGIFLVGDSCIPTHNSSLGRLGLLTHSTAGFIDPGFDGHVTLELSNVANLPIVLYPGMKIGQIAVFQLSSPAEHPYGSTRHGSHYQGQRGPTPSRSWQRFHRADVPPVT